MSPPKKEGAAVGYTCQEEFEFTDDEEYAEGFIEEDFVDSEGSDDEPCDGYEVAIRLVVSRGEHLLHPVDMSGIQSGQTWIVAEGTPKEAYIKVKGF